VRISQVVEHANKSHVESKVLGIRLHVGLGEVGKPETAESYFGKLAERSDAVVRGRVTRKVSHLTEDDAFLFTDYDFVVTEVLKNNVMVPLYTGATITVTRPGGKILLDGVIVKATDDCFAPLPVGNHNLVLFLKFVPETGAYQATGDTGTFEVDGETLRPLTEVPFPPGVLRDGDSFLRTTRAVSTK
jgi:hypothetical protein